MAGEPTYWPEELFFDLERQGPIPLYFQVSSRLEAAIHSGAIPQGARLENELAIADRLKLSRPTIRRAIQELVDKGLLVRRRGIGTQVVQGHVSRQVELTSLFEDLRDANHEPGTQLLFHEILSAPESIASQLSLEAGASVLHVRRLRSSDNVPVAILENYLPTEFIDITREQLEQRGLYQIIRSRGGTIQIAKQTIGARSATAEESELLGLAKNGPVLTMDRVAFDNAGRAIELGHHCYRPDLYRFETTLVAK